MKRNNVIPQGKPFANFTKWERNLIIFSFFVGVICACILAIALYLQYFT